MDEQRVLREIQAARVQVTAAEGALSKLLAEIHGAARAEKTTISEVLREAFLELRAAREHLVTLEKLARGQED
jgi:hypothetical protein